MEEEHRIWQRAMEGTVPRFYSGPLDSSDSLGPEVMLYKPQASFPFVPNGCGSKK